MIHLPRELHFTMTSGLIINLQTLASIQWYFFRNLLRFSTLKSYHVIYIVVSLQILGDEAIISFTHVGSIRKG